MDGSTTYCYFMSEKYSLKQPLEDSVLVQDSGSACPITVRVDIANKLEKNARIPLRYTATLDTSSINPTFDFPEPITKVTVPDYLIGGNNTSDALRSSSDAFDIAVANVVMCDWRACDLFMKNSESSSHYSTTNNPNNFDDNVAVFGSQELVVPKDGKYTGYVHLVVSVAGESRADFITFFPVQVGDVAGTTPNNIDTDGTTTYCWTAKDVSVFDPSVSGDLTIRTGNYCPGTMSMSLSSTEVHVGETVDITWMLDLAHSSVDDSTLIAEVSKTDAIRNPRTGVYSVVPVSVFGGCQRSLANANCSTYSGDESSTFTIAEYGDMNLTSGAISYSTKYTFDTPGQFTMFGRVALVTVDGERIDMAIYSSTTVSVDGGSGGSHVFLYIGIGIGAAILLAGLLFCYVKKRHDNVKMKKAPCRQRPSEMGQASDYTLASSNFLSHRTPAQQLQGLSLSGSHGVRSSNTTPSYLAINAEKTSMFDRTIGAEPDQMAASMQSTESFSLNPYDRASFAGLDDDYEDSPPSEGGKLSMQSAFDNESEWEYDTQEALGVDNGQDFGGFGMDVGTSLPTSGAYEVGQSMPIMEDGDLGRHFADDPQELLKSTSGLCSTTSSGWTVNHEAQ
ncbi:unnamed protein product [Hyaloperonospora brassicae]|uniref:Uncharacterized protein n=1 Tax=Hyaloperonospora brassicae TaxID=162125 RepID=A0AAV0UPL0_HYABA|nr:unnamed protein product [Hyaloperonospora brassicae]